MTTPLWLIGSDPVDLGVTDASVNHDAYIFMGPFRNRLGGYAS